MSRYRSAPGGDVAFVGAEMVLIIERSAAVSMLVDVRRWADDRAGEPIQGAFTAWADDLEGAINAGRVRHGGRD